MNELPPPFDAAAAWAALPEPERARIGTAALALGCALHGCGDGNGYHATALSTASETAQCEILEFLAEAYRPLPRHFRMTPDLNQLGIRACTGCGCTDDHACFPACHWVGPTICSGCAHEGQMHQEFPA